MGMEISSMRSKYQVDDSHFVCWEALPNKCINSCKQDVSLTMELFNYGKKHGY